MNESEVFGWMQFWCGLLIMMNDERSVAQAYHGTRCQQLYLCSQKKVRIKAGSRTVCILVLVLVPPQKLRQAEFKFTYSLNNSSIVQVLILPIMHTSSAYGQELWNHTIPREQCRPSMQLSTVNRRKANATLSNTSTCSR
jgi:hypothetical protein